MTSNRERIASFVSTVQAPGAVVLILLSGLAMPARAATLASPDGDIALHFSVTDDGVPVYAVSYRGEPVLDESRLGLVRDDADFSTGLKLVSLTEVSTVTEDYELATSKRRLNRYRANRRVAELANDDGERIQIAFQLSDDGVAFRYLFDETGGGVRKILAESTSFRLAGEARAWLQPLAPAKSGWSSTNPSYEERYLRDVEPGTVSPMGSDWVFPALFRSGSTWLLLSETGLARNYCGSRLASEWRSPEYRIAFPGPLEHFAEGPVLPRSTLPWTTPWRLVVIGDLETIVESTLGTDLAAPAAFPAEDWADAPGRASWSWVLLKDGETVPDTQRRFIDYAADMGWEYTLVDSMWDTQIGFDGIAELVEYGRERGVKILLWYNSAGDWNSTPLTPRDRMLTRERRRAEMQRLENIGVAGLKVDFFGGDGQSVMTYYQDILEDAADFGLAINFHGSTLPRGWQRTYPNLMTMESVRGLEFVTFEQRNADDEPAFATMLPFTRNVFDPMDYTPVVLDEIPNIDGRTSSAFQLALSVLFTSGIQHYAEIPAGMAKAPGYVREFLRSLPRTWDDIEFLEGFPGEYVVLARKVGDDWFLAGINGTANAKSLSIDVSGFGAGDVTVISDGNDALGFRRQRLSGPRVDMRLAARGGFVAHIEN